MQVRDSRCRIKFSNLILSYLKDPTEKADHVWQDEINQYFEFEVKNEWKEIGMPEIEMMEH